MENDQNKPFEVVFDEGLDVLYIYDKNHIKVEIDRKDISDLVHRLLHIPVVQELNDSYPAVLYFGTDNDRQEFLELVKQSQSDLMQYPSGG